VHRLLQELRRLRQHVPASASGARLRRARGAGRGRVELGGGRRGGGGGRHAAAAEPPSPGQIRLEEFNFPRGFKMRASAEPCRVAAAAPATDGSAAAGGDVMKNGSAAEADEQRAKELVLINVPDVRQCAVCRCFHTFQ